MKMTIGITVFASSADFTSDPESAMAWDAVAKSSSNPKPVRRIYRLMRQPGSSFVTHGILAPLGIHRRVKAVPMVSRAMQAIANAVGESAGTAGPPAPRGALMLMELAGGTVTLRVPPVEFQISSTSRLTNQEVKVEPGDVGTERLLPEMVPVQGSPVKVGTPAEAACFRRRAAAST